MIPAGGRRNVRVRRSPHLVAYWRRGVFVAYNYATDTKADLPARACELLNACGDWTPVADLANTGIVSPASFATMLDRLVKLTLLERSDQPRDRRAIAMDALRPWNPQVGFFHAATRNVRYTSTRVAARVLEAKAAMFPPPKPIKKYRSGATIPLEPVNVNGEFTNVLRARRTWRRYSSEPVTRQELATVLGLSVGVQKWVEAGGMRMALKTSPSGGARHSVECYVVARDVRGLKSGIYHYAPDRHALVRIGRKVSNDRLRSYVPGSEYFANASAMIFFTSIFERLLWRYPYPRAYRAALIESGHVCQTFCLTATRLGLAPFSVMALADSIIEKDLGIDGISESVLYAAGIGRPPRGTTWASRPKGPNPRTRQNPRLMLVDEGKKR